MGWPCWEQCSHPDLLTIEQEPSRIDLMLGVFQWVNFRVRCRCTALLKLAKMRSFPKLNLYIKHRNLNKYSMIISYRLKHSLDEISSNLDQFNSHYFVKSTKVYWTIILFPNQCCLWSILVNMGSNWVVLFSLLNNELKRIAQQ